MVLPADDVGVVDDGGTEAVGDVIDRGVVDGAGRRLTLVAVSDANWREIADVAPRDDPRAFVPPSAAGYPLLSSREEVWHSLGVRADTHAVRLSYQPENVAARAMYVDLGFVESDIPVDDEIMAELTATRAESLL